MYTIMFRSHSAFTVPAIGISLAQVDGACHLRQCLKSKLIEETETKLQRLYTLSQSSPNLLITHSISKIFLQTLSSLLF